MPVAVVEQHEASSAAAGAAWQLAAGAVVAYTVDYSEL